MPKRVTAAASGIAKTPVAAPCAGAERAEQRREAMRNGRALERLERSSQAIPDQKRPGLPVDIASIPRELPVCGALIPVCGGAYMRYAVPHTTYALTHTSGKRAKGFSELGRMRQRIHGPQQQYGTPWRQKCTRVHAISAKGARLPSAACGVAKINSARSQMDTRAPHTVVGRNRRCRKGLEPSRRVSETAGPRHLTRSALPSREQG